MWRQKINETQLFVSYGPMQLVIQASWADRVLWREMNLAADYAVGSLNQLAQVKELARLVPGKLPPEKELPAVLRKMADAVLLTGDDSLTCMAAVAGSIADLVADRLVLMGADRVIVNNGGDIALRLAEGKEVRVGLTSGRRERRCHSVLTVRWCHGIGGLATSGLGGRSFTRGIATAATVLAASAARADAFATLVGNAVTVDSPVIERTYARNLDPETDIPDLLVTVRAGNLTPDLVEKAMARGVAKAAMACRRGLIYGAVISVGERLVAVPPEIYAFWQPVKDRIEEGGLSDDNSNPQNLHGG